MINRTTVYQLLDNLSADQMDAIVAKARDIVDMIDCADEDTEHGTEYNTDK